MKKDAEEAIPSNIGYGIAIAVKKATADPKFRRRLLEKRAAAAQEAGIVLTSGEAMILNRVPQAQLEAMVGNTQGPTSERPASLGRVGASIKKSVSRFMSLVFGKRDIPESTQDEDMPV
jgi:hypothetical protein